MVKAIDFASAYEAWDGDMENCDGATCGASCCNTKEVATWGKGRRPYITTLDPDEYEFQIDEFGDLPEGVTAERYDIGAERTNIKFLVNGCLGPNGECRLQGRKPIACRTFPMKDSELFPIVGIENCPRVRDIAKDTAVQAGMCRLRKAMGHDSNEGWLKQLDLQLNR